MKNQKHLFDIAEDVVYLNAAYMSPLLKSTNTAGKSAIDQKSRPYTIAVDDFFTPLNELKKLYAKLIDTNDYQRITAIPSASYGIATVANNIKLNADEEVLIIDEQFPSNVYSWKRLTEKYNAKLKIIDKPSDKNQGKFWNKTILESITSKTAVVALGHIHWASGTIFDIKAISKKAKEHNALLIIDGSQSIGALPFSVEEIQPDALICVSYKWLFGPYSFGLAYYSSYFDDGIPIEESYSNRLYSENLAGLVNYESQYKTQANRYNMGESANFIAIPMLKDSISKILEWSPKSIQEYCDDISKHIIKPLKDLGCKIEDSEYRAKHLFGIKLPDHIDKNRLENEFKEQNIFISNRGDSIRISCHLFNTKQDFDKLLKCITASL